MGPFVHPPFSYMHCLPLGAVDKPDGSVRLILDLSAPQGDAVNERIDKDVPNECFPLDESSRQKHMWPICVSSKV